jgi:AAHS family 4-hydroxybenzoate transporter-like MFS transporter
MAVMIDVEDIVERQTDRLFRLTLMVWMSVTMVVEGFDNQVQAYTAPAIIRAWRISPASFGTVIVAFQFGFMLGVASLGNLGDIFGRRLMIIIGVLVFGALTVAGAYMRRGGIGPFESG